jgi:predicted permease
VTPGFFDALGTSIVKGRDVDDHDAPGTQPVVVVSRRFAAKAWPGLDPIGRRLIIGNGTSRAWITVVGLVSDVRYRSLTVDVSRNPEDPDVYFPYGQRPDRGLALVVSTGGNAARLIAPVRDAIHSFDRDIPTFSERPMTGLIDNLMAPFRLSAGVMSFFGVIALLLAGIGVYGLLNYSVTQRRQEIGVRVALGAGRGEIYRLVVTDAMKLTIGGLVIGAAAALPCATLIGTQLYGVTTSDPATYASIVLLLLLVGIAATVIPARRASRVDPIVALRAE